MNIDTLIEARWVVPITPSRTVLENHAVAMNAGVIVAVLPMDEARAQFTAQEHIVLDEHALLPGLINLHTHAAMSLLRGYADDRALMDWLKHHIWVAEAKHVSDEFVYDGTSLAAAEMLRAGVTCFNDMYFFPQAAARAAHDAGMRAALGMLVLEFPSAYASDAQDYLDKGLALRDELRDEPLLSFCFAPHAPYTISDKTFERIATYVGEFEAPVHIHLHETRDEIEQSLKEHGARPLARLDAFCLLSPNLIAVHAVHLTHDEIALLAKNGCHIAHCPTSNLKLASGIAPVPALFNAGMNVGIGTDSAASNNRLDMFAEMKLAALLAKTQSDDATTMPAFQALEAATINAARALGLDAKIGSLEVGKCADITAVKLAEIETLPCYDVASQLVYAAGREHVSDVWVNGKRLLQDRQLTTLDTQELRAKAAFWENKIRN